jgi:hypothetical protein
MPPESIHRHVDSTELGHDIRTSREFRDVLLPFGEYLCAPAFVRSDSQRTAEVIEHDRRIRVRLRQFGHRRHLRMVPRRCMFESNFPVDRVSCSYVVLWNAFKKIAAGFTRDEKTQLFQRTASEVYRLTLTTKAPSRAPAR